jgi:hypothetical protein
VSNARVPRIRPYRTTGNLVGKPRGRHGVFTPLTFRVFVLVSREFPCEPGLDWQPDLGLTGLLFCFETAPDFLKWSHAVCPTHEPNADCHRGDPHGGRGNCRDGGWDKSGKLERLQVVMPDTSQTLPSGSASASRTTFTYGNALIPAVETLKRRIFERALLLAKLSLVKEIAETDLVSLPDGVREQVSGRTFPLAAIAQTMDAAARCCTSSYTGPPPANPSAPTPSSANGGCPTGFFLSPRIWPWWRSTNSPEKRRSATTPRARTPDA